MQTNESIEHSANTNKTSTRTKLDVLIFFHSRRRGFYFLFSFKVTVGEDTISMYKKSWT
jgi:hypothetical protein